MDDEEALLDNDPLAIYLKNENIRDFETADLFPVINNNQHEFKSDDTIFETCEISQSCLENILQSELLLEEDYNILDLYVSNNVTSTHIPTITRKIIIFGSMTLINVALFKYTNLKYVSTFSSLCAVPLSIKLYQFMHKQFKKRVITLLLKALNKCSNTFKKYVRYITELSTTIGYYSSASITNSSINTAYIRFVKNVYGTLLNIIKELAFSSTKIISLVPLKIENELQYKMKEDLFLKEDITITDLKILFELYLLVQSDFVKTLGLSLCNSLWKNSTNNMNNVIKISKILTLSLYSLHNNLEKEYLILRNYGNSKNIRSPKKVNNTPSDHMISCLYNTELHFQQLLCKSRDLQNIIIEIKSLQEDEKTKIVSTILSEMESQLFSCKNMLESVTKYFYQIQNKTLEIDNKVTMPQPISNLSILKSVEDVERDLAKQDKLTYELYIPKEGLPLSELEVNTERAVFSMKNLDYSNVLLQELRTILKVRNPEIFEEQQQNKMKSEIYLSESDEEVESLTSRRRKNDVFRPIQPVGLAENLQTISQVMAARKNMLQCEEICEDTFGSSGSSDNDES